MTRKRKPATGNAPVVTKVLRSTLVDDTGSSRNRRTTRLGSVTVEDADPDDVDDLTETVHTASRAPSPTSSLVDGSQITPEILEHERGQSQLSADYN